MKEFEKDALNKIKSSDTGNWICRLPFTPHWMLCQIPYIRKTEAFLPLEKNIIKFENQMYAAMKDHERKRNRFDN